MLIKELTLARGAAGDEYEIRGKIRNQICNYVNEISTDSIGNLYAVKAGGKNTKKIMLAAHMDEVGFMVTAITDNGMLKFRAVGSINEEIAASKRVEVGTKKIPGVIGMKPVHLQEKEEKKQPLKIKQMYIDIGCSKKEEAEKLVNLGDYIYFQSEFVDMGNKIIKSKALDDRVGCAVLIEILKESYDCVLQACFTVQEEIGLRGAGIAAYNLKPDTALIIEGTTCVDVPGVERHQMVTRLGEGPAVSVIDRTSYANKELVNTILQTAKEENIKIQIKEGIFGGNDAGKIQTSLEGIPTVVISVPCRYIHSPNSIMSLDDFEGTVKLVKAVLKNIGR